jgi:hypothetical protein
MVRTDLMGSGTGSARWHPISQKLRDTEHIKEAAFRLSTFFIVMTISQSAEQRWMIADFHAHEAP